MKRILSLVIVVIFALTMVSCVAEAEKTTITISLQLNSLVTDYDDNYFTN